MDPVSTDDDKDGLTLLN